MQEDPTVPTTTVIVITLDRAEYLQRCLTCLHAQSLLPDQIIVVDSSKDVRALAVVKAFPNVVYLRNECGLGRMTASRNIGLKQALGDVIAFVDDDAFAHPQWLANLLEPYADPSVGAVGGRALNGQPDEAKLGKSEIGRLYPNGTLTGYFAADPGGPVAVDHIIGCNMSFRRAVLAKLGGFREDFSGFSSLREDSDMSLRVKRLGYRIIFCPGAVVDHVGAPQVKGRRFDVRYLYYVERNHLSMLARNYGLTSPIIWRYLLHNSRAANLELVRRSGGAMARFVARMSGMVVGVAEGVHLLTLSGSSTVRSDIAGTEITDALTNAARTSQAATTQDLRDHQGTS
jgi:GT2 family glycosyltransferase